MRLLILAAAATLAVSGTAMAAQHHHPRHAHAAASTSMPEGAVPADVMNAHDLHMRNLHDSGHNPDKDFAPPS
jgi:hypothetical protein